MACQQLKGKPNMKIRVESEDEGLTALMGKKISLLCANYFYTGILAGVYETQVKLTVPSIGYETGAWDAAHYSDVQSLPTSALYIRLSAVEAYGELK